MSRKSSVAEGPKGSVPASPVVGAQPNGTPGTRPSSRVGFSSLTKGAGAPTAEDIPVITKSAPSEHSRVSSVHGTPATAPRTPTQAELPPPATPESVALERHGSQMSKVSLTRSEMSQHSLARSVSHASGVSQRSARQGSIVSGTGAPRVASTRSLRDVIEVASVTSEQSNSNLVQENTQLKAQVESLQRLLQEKSTSAKVDRLSEEVKTKARFIGKLEKECSSLRSEVAALKTENTNLKKTRRKSVTSQQIEGTGLTDSLLKGKIKDLERQLDDAPSNEQVAQLQENVCTLRQTMAEREVELQVTSQKLDKAQDALIAAIDWETEVKLTETRKALKSILHRSMSPEAQPSARRSATSVVNPASVRSYTVPYPYTVSELQSPPSYGTSVAVQDVTGRQVIYTAAPGSGVTKQAGGFMSQPLSHLVYVPSTGELKDQTGSTFLGRAARVDDTLSKLSILADTAGCKHNIPAPSRSVVVAAHWVDDVLAAVPTSP